MRWARVPWGAGRQAAATGTGLLIGGQGCLVYNEAYETSGAAAAALTYYDGQANNGLVITDYNLAASQSTSEDWKFNVMPFAHGIYVVTRAGAASGSLTVWVDYDPEYLRVCENKALLLSIGADVAIMSG